MTATQNRNNSPGPGHTTPEPATTTPTKRARLPRSRIGGTWVVLVAAAFVLLLLLIFILQNGQRAEVSFLGAHGHLPMGVALLLAAIFGILLVALPGTARIVQLRTLNRRRDNNTPTTPPTPTQPNPHDTTPDDPTATPP